MTGPRFATPYRGGPHDGAGVGIISRALGAPLMPWQELVAKVATERHPDAPDEYRYRTVVVTVPRQAGKTTLLRAISAHRALTGHRRRVFSTAQDGKTARRRWRDLVDVAEVSPLRSAVTVRQSQGSEELRFPNGSSIAPFAPTPTNLHGETPHLVMIDEAWAFDETDGAALMAAVSPAQITLADRQLWIVSTAGTAESGFLNDLVERGRDAVDDPTSRLAYFEWSADPEAAEADPYSAETMSFHPALGHTQQLSDLMEQARVESKGNWFRGYLNLLTGSTNTIVDLAAYDALGRPDLEVPPLADLTIAYAAARDRSAATIAAGWSHGETVFTAVLRTGPGAGWLTDAVEHLAKTGAARIAADGAGATRAVTEDLQQRGVEVEVLTSSEWATACESWLGNVEDGHLEHDAHEQTRAAIEVAVLRPLGGARALSEAASTGNIDAVKAGIIATHLAEHSGYAGVPIF